MIQCLIICTLGLLSVQGQAPAPPPPPPGAASFDVVAKSLTAGDIGRLPTESLMQIPTGTLAQMQPSALNSLPNEVVAKIQVEKALKNTILGEVLWYLPVDTLEQLNWATLIQSTPPAAINGLTPTTIGAIPWTQIMDKMSPSLVGGLSPNVLQQIPPEAFATISLEAFQQINPRVLNTLPLHTLLAIPNSHWYNVHPGTLSGMDKDVLALIDKDLLLRSVQASQSNGWDSIAQVQGERAGTWQEFPARRRRLRQRMMFRMA